jgi:ferrous iron transport protein A
MILVYDGPMNLDTAPLTTPLRVKRVRSDALNLEQARQLEEIGFLPDEQVAVMARAFPGGDPLVVRVGLSTFALRRAEARCVELQAN